jgi:hypothetical protein
VAYILLFTLLLMIAGCITAPAQPGGVITGRVVTDDGNGLSNLSVRLFPASTGQRGVRSGREASAVTDEDGNFRFTDLSRSLYSVNVFPTKEYAMQPLQGSERRERRYYRVGDNITLTLVKGGVITGKVTTADGQPMTGVQVFATMVRDAEGHPVRQSFGGRPRMTDDRGIYRLFGLPPGTYIVNTSGRGYFYGMSPSEGDVPTYYPSSTRDTAAEVLVTSGGEATGVDIRFRNERGHVISGTVTGGGESSSPLTSYVSVTLFSVAAGAPVGGSGIQPGDSNKGFAINGVVDGEYEITARGSSQEGVGFVSSPRRITVKGTDVTGIELKLAPMASISGHVVLEASPNACESKSKHSAEEIMITARRDEKNPTTSSTFPFGLIDIAVSDKGEFTFQSLTPGRYRLETRLPGENWYIKSLTAPASAPRTARRAPTARPGNESDVSLSGSDLKSGDKISGLTLTVTEGAAGLRGRVVAEKEGSPLPSRLRIHLVPAEVDLSDEVLRYAETVINKDGVFGFANLAPGRYWLLTRPVPDDEPADRPATSAAWDKHERGKLRKEAEAKKLEVELRPCQRVSDYSISF